MELNILFYEYNKVYGEETLSRYCENTKCVPEDDYGKSKLKAENYFLKQKVKILK